MSNFSTFFCTHSLIFHTFTIFYIVLPKPFFSAKKILPESKEIYDMECAPTISLSFLIFKFLKVFVYLLRKDQDTGNRVRGIPSYGETVYRNIDLMEDQVTGRPRHGKTELWVMERPS